MKEAGFSGFQTVLPGPQAQAMVERSQRVVAPSLLRVYPLVVKRAYGCIVEDVDGHQFLDCMAGIAVCSTGHCHPRVVRAIQEQAKRWLHICGADFYDPQYITLAERLAAIAPGEEPKKVFLGNSGAEAVEAALKLARYHAGRPYMIAFFGAFHGRTMGAVSLTASKPVHHRGFAPLLPGIVHIPYGYCYRCAYNLTYPSCNLACVDFIEHTLMEKSIPPDEVAAIFVEPVQGEGGYVVPPNGWLQKLRALCDRYGILLVADEVQSGMGRTGKWFAIEHWNVVPDILCVAKALASGMPVSAMVARESVMTWPVGAHGSTFGGNPVACAAALATIEVIEQDGLMENAVRVGNRLLDGLRELAREGERAGRPPFIGDVRGLGLMIGVELVQDPETRAPAREEAAAVMRECFHRGLLVLTCGASSIRFAPPLVITEAEADRALAIFADALGAVGR